MIGHKDLLMQRLYYEEAIRQAEEERLLRQLRANGSQGDRLPGRALIWLGRRLVAWGQGLQERYGVSAAAS